MRFFETAGNAIVIVDEANDLIPEIADYQSQALQNWREVLPAFIRVNCETDEITRVNPPRAPRIVRKPEDFGDRWSDPLTADDKIKIRRYFTARETLREHFGFIEVSAGGSGVSGCVISTLGIVNLQRAFGREPVLPTSGKHYAHGSVARSTKVYGRVLRR